jgi:hypothetical protein
VIKVAILWPIVFGGVIAPTSLVAQEATYFEPLVIPPGSVGTCLATRTLRTARDSVREVRLVMTSGTPNRRREIMIARDLKGGAIALSDISFASTGRLSSNGEQVVAQIDAAGQPHGFRVHTATQMSDSGGIALDTASLRAMREHAVRRSSRERLDVTDERKVQKLADWMRKRCPA